MKTLLPLSLLVILIKLTSCGSSKPALLLQGTFDTSRLSKYELSEPIIQKGDLLGISVYSDDPEATAIYNLPNVGGAQGDRNTAGYLVDNEGNIKFQGIGALHVEGMTKAEVSQLLNTKLIRVLKNPYYNIRFLNYKITLVGEVTREGVYTIPNENVNLLEAIGLAGGLTPYAKRESVLIIRQINGKRDFGRVDLTKAETLESPYFVLRQNDMIVIDPIKKKSTPEEERNVRNISIATSIVSTLAIVYTVLFKR